MYVVKLNFIEEQITNLVLENKTPYVQAISSYAMLFPFPISHNYELIPRVPWEARCFAGLYGEVNCFDQIVDHNAQTYLPAQSFESKQLTWNRTCFFF